MKTLKYTILIAMVLAVTGNFVKAQTTSRIQSFDNAHGPRVITRVYSSGRLVHYFSKPDNKNVFLFPYPSINNSNVRRFIFPTESNAQGSIYYTINDVTVIGGMCYFCGKKKFENGYQYDLNNNIIITYDSIGFVGRFQLSNLSSAIKYQIRTISGTVNILRMDKHTDPNSDTLLAMVGVANDIAKPTCLVFMHGSGSSWYYNVRKSTDASETFTDIVFTSKYVVAVSKLQGESLKFCLRSADIDDAYCLHDYSTLNNLKQFNTSTLYDPYSSNQSPTWHYDNVQMRMCKIPESDEFCVAYESFYPYPWYGITKNSISLYRMEMSQFYSNQITMTNAQLVRGDISDTGTFADIEFVSYANSTALLHQTSNGSIKSILQLASWSTIGALSSCKSSTESLKSMDVSNNRYLYAAGNIPGNSNMIAKIFQDEAFPSNSCFDQVSLTALQLSPMIIPNTLTPNLSEQVSGYVTWASGGVQVNVTSDSRSILCPQ